MYVEVDGKYIPTGVDLFADKPIYDSSMIAFSPNNDNCADEILFGASFLRNVESGKLTVTDKNNTEVYTQDISYITKTKNAESPTGFHFFWDGSDGVYERYRYPDGIYNFTMTYRPDYDKGHEQTVTQTIILDTKAPSLREAIYEKGMLSVSADDENSILRIALYCTGSNTPSVYMSAGNNAEFDLTDYTGNEIYYEITDIAHNTTTGKLTLTSCER